MIEDLTKSIKASLYDRTASPLFGTYIVSWAIWNYKVFFVLFSSMQVDKKFTYIHNNLYGTYLCIALAFIVPALITAFYLYAYPYLAKPVFEFSRKRQKDLKVIKQKIEDTMPLTIEESRRIRRQLTELEVEYEGQLKRKSDEAQRFKDIAVQKDEAIASLKKQLEQTKPLNTVNAVSDDELKSILQGGKFKLIHNPEHKRAKTITFDSDGTVGEGANENEYKWRVSNSKLELLQKDGRVHSRFFYNQNSRIFQSTNEQDVVTPVQGQYITPEI